MDFSLSEELTMIRDMARDFVTNELLPIERQVLVREKGGTRGAAIPAESRARLKKMAIEQGLWAMTAPEALGGGGLGSLGACLVAEELGKTFVDFDFGDIPPLLFEANSEQQAQYLAPAIAGEKECALALREPSSHSVLPSPSNFGTRAVRDGDDWLLDGCKLAPSADFFLVFAATDEGVTCFIVDGVDSQEGQIVLDHHRVPGTSILGTVGGALDLGSKYQDARRIRAAARKVGIAARLLEMSGQYARDWKSLGQPLAVRPAVQYALADMAIEVDAARWLVYRAACEIDEAKEAREDTVRASLFASEMVQRVIERTVAVYGGPGHAPEPALLHLSNGSLQPSPVLELERFHVSNNLINA